MDKTLIKMRNQIEKIDDKIFMLLEKRFLLSREIGEYKNKKGIRVIDKKREEQLVKNSLKKHKLNRKFVKDYYESIFCESRRLQRC